MQGTLLKRHKAKFGDAAPVTPGALALGAPITLYGKTYLLTDADGFTRDWFAAAGAPLPAALAVPSSVLDDFKATRARTKPSLGPPSCRTDDLARFNEAKLGKPSHVLQADSLAQFLVRPRSPRRPRITACNTEEACYSRPTHSLCTAQST